MDASKSTENYTISLQYVRDTIIKYTSKMPNTAGYIIALAMMLLVSCNKYIARNYIGDNIPSHILVMYRSFFVVIFLFPSVIRVLREQGLFQNSIHSNLSSENTNLITRMINSKFRLRLIRSIIVSGVLSLTYAGYRRLPLGVAATIGAAEPILIAIWSIIPRHNRKAVPALFFNIILGCAGVLFIKLNQPMIDNGKIYSYSTGILLLISANILCSLTPYVTMALQQDKTRSEHEANMVYTNLFSLLITLLIPMIFDPRSLSNSVLLFISNPEYIAVMALIGFIAYLNSHLAFMVFRYIHPTIFAVLHNMSIPLFMFLGAAYNGEPLTKAVTLGGCWMFISTVLTSLHRNTIVDSIKENRLLNNSENSKISLYNGVGALAAMAATIIYIV